MDEENSVDLNQPKSKKTSILFKIATWLLTCLCFYLVLSKTQATAAREGITLIEYLVRFFGDADWLGWLMIMAPYSVFFFLVDSHVTWRVIRWFNAPSIKLTQVLPIRASAYILSLVNEQVGKGAMSLYLLKRYEVPGWQALSTMILLGLMEIYQLLIFSSVGVFLYYELVVEASTLLSLDTILPIVFMCAALYLPIHIWYFRSNVTQHSKLRNVQVFRAFREANPLKYLVVLLCKAPNMIGAIIVYTFALELFNVQVSFGQMLAFLPVIFLAAALPLPFHAGALLLWTVLFPDYPEVG
ncbi:hypothetical protein OAL14_08255, partial [Gammaproteobacteria bacterium]|nr:hypothetical protein [Gammaproteobacteria bacterium]